MTKATARAAAKKVVSEIFLQVWTSRDHRVRSQNPLHWTDPDRPQDAYPEAWRLRGGKETPRRESGASLRRSFPSPADQCHVCESRGKSARFHAFYCRLTYSSC
ncbi:hypothetical protein GDO81_019903 [Engystomops pustulosus]|uniref:Uncharacterized protein n=1 Tax=Engystomops pustulosus TaxID=76066 RepID=A0AAV6Z150_ENGPU|nr:hypothetical protein GDO81_019903 [Engystomops pustulosus]